MSQVSPINDPIVPSRIVRNQGSAVHTSPAAEEAGQDQVEISSMAQRLSDMANTSGIRLDKVTQVRAAIERGDYLTNDKLEKTLDRLLQVLR